MTGAIAVKKIASAAFTSVLKLGEFLQPLCRTLTRSADSVFLPKNFFCISLDKGGLSAAYGSKFLSLIRIKGTKRYQYGGYPQTEEAASSAILAVSELKAEKADVTLNIPKEWVIIKTAELPVAVKENLPDVVQREIDRLTPFSAEDALFDFRVLNEDDKKLTILLAAAKADIVNKYIESLKGKNIVVTCVSLNLSCIGSMLNFVYGNKDYVYMEINNDGFEGALFMNEALREAFTGDFIDGDDNSKAETVLAKIALSADPVKKAGRTPQVLLSLNNMSPSFIELLKSKANIPFKLINENDIRLRIHGGAGPIPYYAVGGVLERLSDKAEGFNLLTKGIRERQKTPVVLTAALLLTIAALGVLNMVMPLKTEQKKLLTIESDMALRKKEVKKFEWLAQEIKTVDKDNSDMKSFRGSRPPSIDIIREITSVLPQNAWLTRMHISETNVELEGYANPATALLLKLEASSYFKKAEFASQTFKDVQKGLDRFQIRMEIDGAKKVETTPKNEEELTDEEL
jgi:Tfp pilus assembly protein PilN